jgi:hypothetical protein
MKHFVKLGAVPAFQTESYNKTPRQAVDEFSNEWPDGKRKVKWLDATTFKFVDGTCHYRMERIPAIRFETVEVYAVFKMEMK